jgi:hypothetical protein
VDAVPVEVAAGAVVVLSGPRVGMPGRGSARLGAERCCCWLLRPVAVLALVLAGAERSMELMHAKLSITIARGDRIRLSNSPDPRLDRVSAFLARVSALLAPSSRAG